MPTECPETPSRLNLQVNDPDPIFERYTVCFAYAGISDKPDLSSVYVTTDLLRQSVNCQLLTEGLVYPTFYSHLYPDLRTELITASQAARTAAIGLRTGDTTANGATVTNLAYLDEKMWGAVVVGAGPGPPPGGGRAAAGVVPVAGRSACGSGAVAASAGVCDGWHHDASPTALPFSHLQDPPNPWTVSHKP
ncbi:hypothetical protein [Actinomadura sp. DC4]|uniref:hypothetical protein n=1 Tax=Actinomadura sp. DC4 TaxID=3055069 RepID=UPI0025B0051D|nr:hypothetical protein [Actinomadura sp. DC4]MDN3357648.1 hypothetical protein [Actinomadura sp. DC4]